jgi:uncharacterized protein YlaI
VTEPSGVSVRCSVCGREDRISAERYAEEYERLKAHTPIHHICADCQARIEGEARRTRKRDLTP